jgi:hypothetical protein
MSAVNYNPMSGAPDYRPDSGITENDMRYLSQKRTLLAMGGTILDDIYYSGANTTVSLSEATYNNGRLAVSLTSPAFGAQSQVIIPNSSLLGACFLHLELPDVVANQALCRGWGYAAIDQISYLFGSSNVSQIAINGQSLWQTVAAQCETSEKRSEMFHLGGEEVIAPTGATLQADLLLPLPWSSANGMHAKLPFDTTLLSNPITIQITFKSAASIYGGTGLRPNAFTMATIYPRQGDLANKDQSLRNLMMRRPDLMYAYPFIHKQSFTPSSFLGVSAASGTVSIPLLSFINADLTGMTIGIVPQSRLAPSASSTPSPFAYEELSNIQLLFNGTLYYNAPGRAYKLWGIDSQVGSSYLENSVVAPGSTSPFTSGPVNSYTLYVDFARIRTAAFEGRYQNVWRIGNNTLSLQFNTPPGTDGASYVMFATYWYNGVAEVSNGETRVYFD